MQQPPKSPLRERTNVPAGQAPENQYMKYSDSVTEAGGQEEASTPPPAKQQISYDSVERNAAAVIQALNETSPLHDGKADLFAQLEAVASPDRAAARPQSIIYNQSVDGVDAELQRALEALDTVQHLAVNRGGGGDGEGSLMNPSSGETHGQRLALFLKEQLHQSESRRKQAESVAQAATQALEATKAELAAAQARATALAREASTAVGKIRQLESNASQATSANADLRRQLHAAELSAKGSADAAATAKADADRVRSNAASQLESAHQRLAELEVRMHVAGYRDTPQRKQRAPSEVEDMPPSPDVFAGLDRPEDIDNDDGTASGAESDDTVGEAEATVRNVARAAARKAARAAPAPVLTGVVTGKDSAPQQQQQQQVNLAEERLLRSEISTLERKCDRADHMLLKANHAMRVLHHKLQKERQEVASLREEKCLLQSQLLTAQQQGPSLDPEQLSTLLQELATCRARLEGLAEERSVLATRLEAAEGQLTVVDKDHGDRQAALERQAEEALASERARAAALDERVQELASQLGVSSAAAAQLEGVNIALQEAQGRCGELAAELEYERAMGSDRLNEIAKLSEMAQAFGAELMGAREEAHVERASAERLAHGKAGLQGRVEALTEALGRLERSDGVLESLAEGQADLQGRLRQAEAAANGARAAAETARADLDAMRAYAEDMERSADVLQSELAAAKEHNEALQAAASSAAQQLGQLAESHAELQRELEAIMEEGGISRSESAALAQRLTDAEGRAEAAGRRAGELQGALGASEARMRSLVDEVNEAISAAHEACARADALQAVVEEVTQERDDARGRADRLEASMQALNAQCDALHRVSSVAEGTNQALVDNMCDMTGLIDAVAALQQRNRLLQEECDVASSRAARAESDRSAATLEINALDRELCGERQRLAASLDAREDLQCAHNDVRAEYAVVSRQLAALEEAHGTLREEHAELTQKEIELRASLVSTEAEDERLRAECSRLRVALETATSEAAATQADLRAVLSEKEELLHCERELRASLAAAEKARSMAEGKLVLAKQKEVRFREASMELRQLQTDIDAHFAETEDLRLEKDAAEDRCAELTGRCMVLLDQMSVLEEDAEAARESAAQERAQRDAMLQELHSTQMHAAQLADQVTELQATEARVMMLEEERQENGQWCDGLSAQLAERSEGLCAAEVALDAAQARVSCLESDVAAAQERAMAAEGAAAAAETACWEARKALSASEQELEATKTKHADLVECLEAMKISESAASERAATAETSLEEAIAQCSELTRSLDLAQAGKVAVEEALQRRISELEASVSSTSGQHAALDEVRRRQVEELQTAVQAGSAACTTLAARVETANQAQRDAQGTCDRLRREAEVREDRLEEIEEELEATTKTLAMIRSERDGLVAACADHARNAELLEVQCGVLRGQVEFMQQSQAKDADLSQGVHERMSEAHEEQRRLREQLEEARQDIRRKAQQLEEAALQVVSAREETATAHAQAETALKRAEEAAAAARTADAARCEAERRCAGLEQQLELVELLKEQGQREVEVAVEAAATARAEATAAQQAAETAERQRRTAAAEAELAVHDVCTRMSAQMAALARVEALVANGAASAGLLEQAAGQVGDVEREQLEISGDISGTTAAAAPEAIRTKHSALLDKLSSVRQGVGRLAQVRLQEEHAAEAAAVDAEVRSEIWQAEKTTMRAVCKLALSVMMDQVGGREDAAATLAELEPTIASHADALEGVGLAPVWDSLRRLARSGAGRRAAEETRRLAAVAAELTARCADLEAAANIEQQHSHRVEGTMREQTDRVRVLTGSVRWATGDMAPHADDEHSSKSAGSAEQLAQAVDALTQAVQRLVRRYRTMTRCAREVSVSGVKESFKGAEGSVSAAARGAPTPGGGVKTAGGRAAAAAGRGGDYEEEDTIPAWGYNS